VPDFTVDATELRRMAMQTYNLYYELDDRELPKGALAGVAADPSVEDAYAGFVGTWSDGLFYARQHLNALADRLSTAANMYTQTEHNIMQAAATDSTSSGK
jgi:hypothetical protein